MLLRACGNLLKHIAKGLAMVIGLFCIEIGLALLSYIPFAGSGYVPDEMEWFVMTVMVLGNVVILGLILLYRRKSRNRRLKAEAQKWLAERLRHPSAADRQRYTRLEGRILWIPTVVALIGFLFLPELAGILSHFTQGGSAVMDSYRVSVPLTWMITSRGTASLEIFYSRGIARTGFGPYLRREAPLESVFLYVESEGHDVFDRYWRVRATELVKSKTSTFVCQDLAPSRPAGFSGASRNALIACETDRRDFHASFDGDRADVPSFYRFLQSIDRQDRLPSAR